MTRAPSRAPSTRQYEGHVALADGSVISLQCFEGRRSGCPDTAPDDCRQPGLGPLDGFYCECSGCPGDTTEGDGQ